MRMTKRRCPHCNSAVDATTLVGEGTSAPDVDDVNVCLYCAKVSVFTAYGLRLATKIEAAEFDEDPDVQLAVRTVETLILENGLNDGL